MFLALTLLGASAPCGTSPISAGSYGYLGDGGPAPAEWVTVDRGALTAHQVVGDRMFTDITATYDAKTLALTSLRRHASCCGSYWQSSVSRNADGTYDVEAQMSSPSPKTDDLYKESRPHMFVAAGTFINTGGFFLVPWAYHVMQLSQILELSFSPLRTDYLSVSQTPAAPYPDNVPTRDKALELNQAVPRQSITLWYDPCTFTLDAYGSRENLVWVRTAVL